MKTVMEKPQKPPLVRAPKEGWWKDPLALPPRKAVVYERVDQPRADGTPPLYVQQWSPELGNWQKHALGMALYDIRGKRLSGGALTTAKQTARVAALEVLRRWEAARAAASDDPTPAPHLLTIGATAAVITDLATGKYPHDTPYRREVLRALAFAGRVWGEATPWEKIGKAHLRELGRRRVDDVRQAQRRATHPDAPAPRGLRPAEITVGAVIAVATWLRDENKIDERAALPSSRWKEELREYWTSSTADKRPYEVHRPRHTVEESRAILSVAGRVDPRLDLVLAIGAELRAGQVERARRSDLTVAANGTPIRVVIHTRGKKQGATVLFTRGQQLAVRMALETGYLRLLEAAYRAGTVGDYRLFPAGQLRGGRLMQDPVALVETHELTTPIAKTALLDWFHEAEQLAEVHTVPGRAFYGVRRQGVDEAIRGRISKHGLKHWGGWADTQIPDAVYANQEAEHHLVEAMEVRARFRGEALPGEAEPGAPSTLSLASTGAPGGPSEAVELGASEGSDSVPEHATQHVRQEA